MNFDQFRKKNLGRDVKIRPMVRSENAGTGSVLALVDDLWKVDKVESRTVELLNLRTKQSVEIQGDNFREFRTPNFLMLRCQLTLTEEHVLIEPLVGGGGDPTPEPATDRALPAAAPDRPTIREKSAAEILSNLKGTRFDYDDRVGELYRGRWTRDPGWRATVASLPSKLSSDAWFCSFLEVGSAIIVTASTIQDVSALRRGDAVIVSGKISDVSRLDYVHLADATVLGDEGTALSH